MLIDSKALIEFLENDLETLKEIYDLFCEESEEGKSEIQAAIRGMDSVALKSATHKLKGMMANFMARSTCDLLSKLEEIDPTKSMQESKQLFAQLEEHIRQLHLEIKGLINGTEEE